MIVAYTIYNILVALLGKRSYGSWFNPVSLYSLVWEIAVGLHESKLITFYELSGYTWFIIFLMQTLFVVSCFAGIHSKLVIGNFRPTSSNEVDNKELKKQIKKYIIITTSVASIAIFTSLYGTISRFGTQLLSNLTSIYAARVYNQETAKTIPYIGSFLYIALPLCGIYLKRFGFSFLAVPPFVLAFLDALNSGGRAGIVFSMILFASAYYITDMNASTGKKPIAKRRKVFMYIGVAIFAVMIIVISIQRNAGQNLTYATPAFEKIFGNNLLVYKTMTYIAGPIGVLNEYLKTSELHFGQNTFLTVFNLLNKLGIGERVEQYQEWFYTPLPCNVGTFIRELIEDFTVVGAAISVLIFGYATSRSYMNAKKDYNTRSKVMWAILSLVLLLSFFDWKLRSSNIWIALLFGFIICSQIDRKARINRRVEL